MPRTRLVLVAITAVTLLAAACGNDTASSTTTGGAESATPEPNEDGVVEFEGLDDSDAPPTVPAGERGSATFTVGDETWTFDTFRCGFGTDETGNDEITFVGQATSESDGKRIYIDATRFDRDNVITDVLTFEIGDPGDLETQWSTAFGDEDEFLVIDEPNGVSAETGFVDEAGETSPVSQDRIPGTLEAICGS